MHWNWASLLYYLPKLLHASILTIELVVCALLFGIACASVLSISAEATHSRILIACLNVYGFIFRGTPVLVQIFLIYYGVAQLSWVQENFLWPLFKQPFFCAILALGLNTTAYTTVLMRGAIQAIPAGEREACRAMGMSTWMMYRRILFPRALRIVLPAYSNEAIMVLKTTALTSAIALADLTGVTQAIMARTYLTLQFLLVASLIYLLLNLILTAGFKLLEKRCNRYMLK